MDLFQYSKPATVNDAIAGVAQDGAKFVAGGTTLIDLMKLDVERPNALVDINILPLARIEPQPTGGLKIGRCNSTSPTSLPLKPSHGDARNYRVVDQQQVNAVRNIARRGQSSQCSFGDAGHTS